MNAEEHDLLALFWEDRESLMWNPDNQPSPFLTYGDAPRGPVVFSVNCSDTFYWACADAEPIELPDDLESLRACHAEFTDEDWPLLWVCRKRGTQPMPRYFGRTEEDRAARSPFRDALRAPNLRVPEPS